MRCREPARPEFRGVLEVGARSGVGAVGEVVFLQLGVSQMSFTHTLRRRAAHFNSSLEDEPAQWPPSNSGRLSSSASQSPYEPVVISGTDRVCANVRKAGSAPHHLWFASDQVATGLSTTGAQPSNARIFESPEFKSSLMSAGYTEMIDVSRKKIKARFTHAYSKAEVSFTHLYGFSELTLFFSGSSVSYPSQSLFS